MVQDHSRELRRRLENVWRNKEEKATEIRQYRGMAALVLCLRLRLNSCTKISSRSFSMGVPISKEPPPVMR